MNLNTIGQSSQSAMASSVIIRLQNLAWEARSHDIRQFFGGLVIPDGGVHIIGGPDGDAFIAFQSDEDARKAMLRNGHTLCGNQVRLMLSSKSEMYSIIAQAKMSNPYNAALSLASQSQSSASGQSSQRAATTGSALPHWLHESPPGAVCEPASSDAVPSRPVQHQVPTSICGANIAMSSQANVEPRKLTVGEVQEKLSAMLNARSGGSGHSKDEANSAGTNENERVALNFAHQLFSLLEMSTPASGNATTSQASSAAAVSTSELQQRQNKQASQEDSLQASQIKQSYSIPGLGNPSEIRNTHCPNTPTVAFSSPKFDQQQQQTSNALPSNPSFPVVPLSHLAPFAPGTMPVILPPPTQNSFDMTIPAPPPVIQPRSEHAQYTTQRPVSYVSEQATSAVIHDQISPTPVQISDQGTIPTFTVPHMSPLHEGNEGRTFADQQQASYQTGFQLDGGPGVRRLTTITSADITEPFLKLSNLSDVQTYKIVRQLFHPVVKLRLRDLKLINDPQGQRTGQALLSFPSVDDARAALRIAVERSQGNVGVHVCTEYEFVCAVDSYMSSAMRKRNGEGFHAMRVIGFPSKWDKRDFRRFFDGVNFHSRDKIQILETDSRNPLHNIAIALLASQLDMERAMFYDGEETGHGRLSVSAVTKEQVELETSSARYRQQHRERGDNPPSSSGSRGGSSAPYEGRPRRVDEDKPTRTSERGSEPLHETKRFRPEEESPLTPNSASFNQSVESGSVVRLSGFPVLYTENDMRSLLIRAQLIPSQSESSVYPVPEVTCLRDKTTSRLTGEVLVKFHDSSLCKRALARAKHVLAGKSIEAEILGPNRQTVLVKRSRGEREGSYRPTSFEHHDNRFRSSDATDRSDFDDRRRPGSPNDPAYRPSKSTDTKHRIPRRDGDRREGPSRFDKPSVGDGDHGDTVSSAGTTCAQKVDNGTINYDDVQSAGDVQNYGGRQLPNSQLTMGKRPLLPDPVLLADTERNRMNTGRHMPPQMQMASGQATMPPPYPDGSYTRTSLGQMRPNMMARPPLNLPPIPAELVHLKGQIMLLDNVPYRATKEDICGWLSQFKPIESTLKIRHDDSGRPTGHAIVAMETRQDAEAACAMLRGTQLLGRLIQTMLM